MINKKSSGMTILALIENTSMFINLVLYSSDWACMHVCGDYSRLVTWEVGREGVSKSLCWETFPWVTSVAVRHYSCHCYSVGSAASSWNISDQSHTFDKLLIVGGVGGEINAFLIGYYYLFIKEHVFT